MSVSSAVHWSLYHSFQRIIYPVSYSSLRIKLGTPQNNSETKSEKVQTEKNRTDPSHRDNMRFSWCEHVCTFVSWMAGAPFCVSEARCTQRVASLWRLDEGQKQSNPLPFVLQAWGSPESNQDLVSSRSQETAVMSRREPTRTVRRADQNSQRKN